MSSSSDGAWTSWGMKTSLTPGMREAPDRISSATANAWSRLLLLTCTSIGAGMPWFRTKVELEVEYTEPGARGDTSGNVTKLARLTTGLEIKAPLYIQVGEKVKVYTETREVAGRA